MPPRRYSPASFPALRQAAPHLFGGPAPTDPDFALQGLERCAGQVSGLPRAADRRLRLVRPRPRQRPAPVHRNRSGCTRSITEKRTPSSSMRASREVAGILGTGDGSYGAAAVKAMTTIGLVSREMLGTDGTYSGDRAKEWGQTGPPHDVELEGGALQARLRRPGLDLGRPGGGDHQRISRHDLHGPGIHTDPRRGRLLRGQRDVGPLHAPGRRPLRSPGACIIQSWGPDVPDGPTVLGQPDFSFWAEQDVIEQNSRRGG